MLASQRFYASWKAFIRELVLNAIDACNVRQALEWSWGTEFLEMEQANQMREVRQIYEPRIDITLLIVLLDSKTRKAASMSLYDISDKGTASLPDSA